MLPFWIEVMTYFVLPYHMIVANALVRSIFTCFFLCVITDNALKFHLLFVFD